MTELRHRDSIRISRSPHDVWDLVSDVTRTGEWSPICRSCAWDDGDEPGPDGPRVGAGFSGHNETPDRAWDTHSQVVSAERGRVFGWEVGGGWVRWGYELEPDGDGTVLTETWHFTEGGQAGFVERYGEGAPEQISERTRAAQAGIPATLARIKQIAESE